MKNVSGKNSDFIIKIGFLSCNEKWAMGSGSWVISVFIIMLNPLLLL